MATVTVRPTSTVTNGSAVVHPSGTRHGVTSDDSDTTYIDFSGSNACYLGFASPTIPSGAKTKRIAMRARSSTGGYAGALTLRGLRGYTIQDTQITWLTPTTTTVYTQNTTEAASGLTMGVKWQAGASTPDVFELYLDWVYVAKPVVSVSTPTGTVTDTDEPVVTWSVTSDSDGGAVNLHQIKIFSAAQYGAGGFDPETSTPTLNSGSIFTTDTTWTPTAPLADATYRAYVKTAQYGYSNWSDWAYSGFTISVGLPAVPTVIATAQSASGRIQIDLHSNAGTATTSYFEAQRSADGGTTWEALRRDATEAAPSPYFTPVSTKAHTWDYEAPNGTLMSYRARAVHNYSGLYASSAWSSTVTATWSSGDWWLKSSTGAGNQIVIVRALPSYQRTVRQGQFQPLGSSNVIVVSDGTRSPASGSVTFRLDTLAAQVALDAALDLDVPLLLQGPAAHYWTQRWLRLGDQDRARVSEAATVQPVFDTYPWVEVTRPDGTLAATPAADA